MKSKYEVLSDVEIEQLHAASMNILAETGVKVEYNLARNLFREAGCLVTDEEKSVRIPEKLVKWAVNQAPDTFTLYGNDPAFQLQIGKGNLVFAGLGTPTSILDNSTGQYRQTTFEDLLRHIKLINACKYIHSTQMDVWPNDIPMTTIHTEAIRAWAHHSHKPFGMGCYGYIPTHDMMRLMAIAVGGKEELRSRPRFFAICSVVSPLQMNKEELDSIHGIDERITVEKLGKVVEFYLHLIDNYQALLN